jgi:hypothetical protein
MYPSRLWRAYQNPHRVNNKLWAQILGDRKARNLSLASSLPPYPFQRWKKIIIKKGIHTCREIIFYSVWFLLKKIIKTSFYFKKITKISFFFIKPKMFQTDWFWFGYLREKTGSNRLVLVWLFKGKNWFKLVWFFFLVFFGGFGLVILVLGL